MKKKILIIPAIIILYLLIGIIFNVYYYNQEKWEAAYDCPTTTNVKTSELIRKGKCTKSEFPVVVEFNDTNRELSKIINWPYFLINFLKYH
jgi:hypothetical protein